MKIEVIDYQSPSAAQQLVKSFRSSGFAVLHNHPIPLQLFKDVQAHWQRFFACDELKKEFMFDRNAYPQDGYFPTESAKGETVDDLKEFFHIYRNAPSSHAVNDDSWALYDASFAIGQAITNWLDQETPDEVKAHFSCPLLEMMDPIEQTLLRVIHYPPLKGGEQAGAIRAAAHHDINLVTILPSAEEPGLQVLDLQGNWVDVPADPGMVVVNSGEMLNICSKGYYPATTHRVCNPSAERMQHARYSFPLFVHAKSHVIIDTENELSQCDLLTQRFADLGLK